MRPHTFRAAAAGPAAVGRSVRCCGPPCVRLKTSPLRRIIVFTTRYATRTRCPNVALMWRLIKSGASDQMCMHTLSICGLTRICVIKNARTRTRCQCSSTSRRDGRHTQCGLSSPQRRRTVRVAGRKSNRSHKGHGTSPRRRQATARRENGQCTTTSSPRGRRPRVWGAAMGGRISPLTPPEAQPR